MSARRALFDSAADSPAPSASAQQPAAGAPSAAVAGTAANAASTEAHGGDEANLGLFDYKQMGAALAQLILLQARAP